MVNITYTQEIRFELLVSHSDGRLDGEGLQVVHLARVPLYVREMEPFVWRFLPCAREYWENTHKEKTRKQNVHGIVPGFFLGGDFVYVFLSPIRNKKKTHTHKQNFGTHPVPGQSRKFVYVYVFLLSLRINTFRLPGDFWTHMLGPAKAYILRGTPRTYAIKTQAVTDN